MSVESRSATLDRNVLHRQHCLRISSEIPQWSSKIQVPCLGDQVAVMSGYVVGASKIESFIVRSQLNRIERTQIWVLNIRKAAKYSRRSVFGRVNDVL